MFKISLVFLAMINFFSSMSQADSSKCHILSSAIAEARKLNITVELNTAKNFDSGDFYDCIKTPSELDFLQEKEMSFGENIKVLLGILGQRFSAEYVSHIENQFAIYSAQREGLVNLAANFMISVFDREIFHVVGSHNEGWLDNFYLYEPISLKPLVFIGAF